MKVLIVEDNPPMRRVIRRVINGFADEIIECGDGRQAVDLYAAQLPDWVLMDIEMIETDGITATRRIIRSYPDAKIVIVTNYNDDALRRAATEAGASGYVLKEDLLSLQTFLATH